MPSSSSVQPHFTTETLPGGAANVYILTESPSGAGTVSVAGAFVTYLSPNAIAGNGKSSPISASNLAASNVGSRFDKLLNISRF